MSQAPSGAQKRQERRAAESLDEVAPALPVPTVVPAKGVWRGYVMVPAKGASSNAWYLQLVEIPLDVVEAYAVDGRRCPVGAQPDQRQTQMAKILEWTRNPELIREWL